MKTRTLGRMLTCWALLLTAAATASAGMEKFTLTRAIPEDVFFAAHARSHDGQAFVDEQYARIWDAVRKAHFERDFKKMLQSTARDSGVDDEMFNTQWQNIQDLLAAVQWSTLGKRESAFAMKMGFPSPEFVLLMMPPKDRVADDFAGLTSIMANLSTIDPQMLMLTVDGEGEEVVQKLAPAQTPFPISIMLARSKDVILVGFGSALPEQSLAMLRGEKGTTLASTQRFKEAFAKLPAPEDKLSFVDLSRMMGQLRGIVDQAISMVPPDAQDEEFAKGSQIPGKLFDMVDMFEYAAEVQSTDGMHTKASGVTMLKDGANKSPLYDVFVAQKPLSNPFRFIPANASNMSASTGIKFVKLYDVIINFIEKNIPDGESAVAEIKQAEDEMGLNIRTDILGWIEGSMISFSLPGKTSFSPGEFGWLLRVSDESKAREMIGKALDFVAEMGAQNNLTVAEAEIEGAEGFRSINSPMLGMVGMKAPTIGVHDGFLMVGSSPELIELVMDVAGGKAPNFSENAQFKKEGVEPKDGMMSISFTDLSKFGEETGAALGMVSMVGMFAPPEVMKQPAVSMALGVASKAARIVRKMDFFESSSACVTRDGNALMTSTVLNYRKPPEMPKPGGETGTSE